jgi:uncharacterized membrane-anchored protein YitT (DUF2179 family)
MTSRPLPGSHATARRSISFKRLILNLFLLTAGSCIFAVGVNAILIPKKLLSGGAIGIALVLHYLIPKLNAGVVYFFLNIPLILLGWMSVSRTFVLYTCYGMAVFSLSTALVIPPPFPIENPILAAILAGIICGAGAGITLRSSGSAGGMDILAVYLNKKWGLRIGATSFLANALVLSAGGFCFGIEQALYSLVYVYTSSKVLDYVLTGFNQRKSILIISDHSQAIADQILTQLHRGATFLQGIGAYSGKEKQVVLSIITMTELSRMKELIFDIDPHAFVVVNDTLEVLGKRHGSMRVY